MGETGEQRRHAGHIAVVLARLVRRAEVDVGEELGLDSVALDGGRDHPRGEVVGAHARERAAIAPHRGADRIDYEGLWHGRKPYPCRVGFILGTIAMIAFLVGVLVLVGHFYPGSGADLVDWKPTRSYEDEARLEEEDIEQMIAAQNEMRRRRGAPEMTEQDLRNKVAEDELNRLRGRGPFGGA